MKSQNAVNFTIGIAPKKMSIEQDMIYIKSALLYADSITLISPTASTYLQLIDGADRKNERILFNLLNKVLPFCELVDPAYYTKIQPVIVQIGSVIYSKQYKAAPIKKSCL